MGYIFISYSHKDKDYVHRLQDALQKEGFEVWIDDRIDYGDEWPMVIQDRLDACDAFVLVATEDSYKSRWVQKEVARAQRINKPFFPLLLSGNPWLSIESTQYADVRNRSLPPEKFYKRLSSVASRNKPLPREEPKQEKPAPPSPLPVGEGRVRAKPAPQIDFRLLGIGGVVLLALICGGLGVNYLAHLPVAPEQPATQQATATFELPAATLEIPAKTSTATLELPTETSTATSVPPTPTLGIGSNMISNKDGMVMDYVPAGNFLMGSTDADTLASNDEKPQHTVYLDAFWIDQTDVTNAMYAKCVSAGKCDPPSDANHYSNSSYANHPVVYVNWNKAKTYCEWAGRQLPSEAQWEKAARGADGRIYPWGNTAPDNTLLNYNQNVGDATEVGKYPKGASVYGALDMAGNVWQWVNDWYQSGYYSTLGNNASNPQGPSSGDGRVLRGGSWFSINYDYFVRSAYRYGYNPAYTNFDVGFRCSRSQ